MVTVFINFTVRNFLEWKRIFNENEPLRKKNNINTIGVYISVENSDKITCVVEAVSIEAFKVHFYGDPLVADALRKYAWIDEPIISFCNKIDKL